MVSSFSLLSLNGCFDTNCRYFYNRDSGETTWVRPGTTKKQHDLARQASAAPKLSNPLSLGGEGAGEPEGAGGADGNGKNLGKVNEEGEGSVSGLGDSGSSTGGTGVGMPDGFVANTLSLQGTGTTVDSPPSASPKMGAGAERWSRQVDPKSDVSYYQNNETGVTTWNKHKTIAEEL